MREFLSIWNALTLAEQFRTGAVLIVCVFILVLAAVFCGPVLLAGARDLFPDEAIEDEEAKLVASRQRRRQLELAARVPHQVQIGSDTKLLEAIAHMPHPTNRIH